MINFHIAYTKCRLFFILVVFYTLTCSCQNHNSSEIQVVGDLSKLLQEISGITKIEGQPYIFAINDSGNSSELFCLNGTGKIEKVIDLKNIFNVDWEDLAYDKNGDLFIGDFGNNQNERRDLAIYRISHPITENSSIKKMSFYLEDQEKFPPKKKRRNFDIEAFIHFKGHFYFFTKNRSSDFEGDSKIYKLPDDSSTERASLIGTINTCDDSDDCFITAAAINTEGNMVALLTYNKVFLLTDFEDGNFAKAKIEKIKLKHKSQKEGICFKNDKVLYIVDEAYKKESGNLYELQLD